MSEVQSQLPEPSPIIDQPTTSAPQPPAPQPVNHPRPAGFSGRQVAVIVVSLIALLAIGLALGGFVGYRLGAAEGAQRAFVNLPRQRAQNAQPAPQTPNQQTPNQQTPNFNLPFQQLPFGSGQVPANNPGGPYLGVEFETLTPEVAASENMTGTTGALIKSVVAGSPAAQAGLKAGDVVIAVNGQAVDNNNDLRARVAQLKPNDKITLTIVTGTANGPTNQHDVTATLGEQPTSQSGSSIPPDLFRLLPFGNNGDDNGGNNGNANPALPALPANGPYLGMEFVMLTPDIAARENMTGTTGALIRAVMTDSPAAQAGLKAGDVVTAVNGQTFTDSNTLRDLVQSHKPGDTIKLTIVKGTANGPTDQHDVTVVLATAPAERQFQMPPGLQPGVPSPGSREG